MEGEKIHRLEEKIANFRGFSDADPAAVLDSAQVTNKSIVGIKLRGLRRFRRLPRQKQSHEEDKYTISTTPGCKCILFTKI